MIAYEQYIKINASGMTADEENTPLRTRGTDGEYEDTRDLGNKQLLAKQKAMYAA